MTGFQYTLASGRRIGVSSWGEPGSARLVVFCHPTPGAGQFDPDPLATARSGLGFLSVDRPGYGGSDPLGDRETPTVQRFADDIAEYLRGSIYSHDNPAGNWFPRVAAVGWGFGGTVALSFAARHADIVRRVDAIATLRPHRSARGERYSAVTELRKHGVERSVDSLTDTLADDPPPDLRSLGIGRADPELGTWGLENRIETMIEASTAQGAVGSASDRMAVRDASWADELRGVRCPCVLSYGESDPVAGVKDARWYSRRLASATVVRLPGGHAALAPSWPELLTGIAASFGSDGAAR
jgi:pimeloyl-ACP methyl ester carboxylesterase